MDDSSEIKIENGVPLPSRNASGAKAKYPWLTMDVGDSFLCTTISCQSAFKHLSKANRLYAPRRFSGRTVTKNDVKGVRVWRIA